MGSSSEKAASVGDGDGCGDGVVEYVLGNAEKTPYPSGSFDLVTVMFVLHEAPFLGRYRILREARRLLREGGTLAVVDISSEYRPSRTMLAGEPYVVEYQKNVDRQLRTFQGFSDARAEEFVPGHVTLWLLTRTRSPWNYWRKRGGEFTQLNSYIWGRLFTDQGHKTQK